MSTSKFSPYSIAIRLILILSLLDFVLGCDPYRRIAWTFNPNTTAKSEATSQAVDPNQLFQQMSDFLDDYSKSHSLNCRQPVGPDYKVCSNNSVTLELNKHNDGKVVLQITQLGPVTATKDYKEIRNELLKLLVQRFPQVHVTDVLGIQ